MTRASAEMAMLRGRRKQPVGISAKTMVDMRVGSYFRHFLVLACLFKISNAV